MASAADNGSRRGQRASRTASKQTRVASLARAWLSVAGGTSRTLAGSIVSRKSRGRLVRLAREFGYTHGFAPEPTLPPVFDSAVAPETTPIVVREAAERDGNVTLRELVVLNRIVASRKPKRLFEIGTFDFRTTVNLAANAPQGNVLTLDLPPDHPSALPIEEHDAKYVGRGPGLARTAAADERARITALHGDSASFDFAPYHGAMDFVFVDGAHSYEYVHHDSATALRIAASGAVIVWHDYGAWPGVTEALNELHIHDARFSGLRWILGTTLAVLDTGSR
ncbi:hypothetical protein BH23GEM2_BH23GEM2_23440 [soil metagenome]